MSRPIVVFYSTKSGNTKRFVEKLGFDTVMISSNKDDTLQVDHPYILITPTYGGGHIPKAVPLPVIHFLNNEKNRSLIKGVISTGNRNFGSGFCLAGRIIARKCNVPNLKDVELFGTSGDVEASRSLINNTFECLKD